MRQPFESALRPAIGVMHAARRRLAPGDGSAEGCEGEPDIDRTAQGVTDDPSRPGIQHDGDVNETTDDGNVADVADPNLVGTVGLQVLGQVGEDRLVVVAVRRRCMPSAHPGLKVVLAHEAAHLLVVDHHPLLAKGRSDTAPPIPLERLADPGHRLDDSGVVTSDGLRVIERGTRDVHQPASFCGGQAAGPAMADMGAFRGGGAARGAPFKNSSSRACLPTSRSRAAMRAS